MLRNLFSNYTLEQIPLDAWSKAWVCDFSLAGTVVSNAVAGMDVSRSGVLCAVR
jgi:hypothetical protein